MEELPIKQVQTTMRIMCFCWCYRRDMKSKLAYGVVTNVTEQDLLGK